MTENCIIYTTTKKPVAKLFGGLCKELKKLTDPNGILIFKSRKKILEKVRKNIGKKHTYPWQVIISIGIFILFYLEPNTSYILIDNNRKDL